MKKLFKSFILLFSYIVTLLIGFGLGIYFLPIITAENSNTSQEINKVQKNAIYKTKFSKGQEEMIFYTGEREMFQFQTL